MASITLEPRNRDGSVTVLQITDTHLFADSQGRLLGVNTAQSFQAVLEAIVEQNVEYDYVIMTGDISQDYSADSYRRFAAMVRVLGEKVFFLPGNHDDGPLMYSMFAPLGVQVERRIICGNWQFVLLNSEVYSMAHGWLQRDQLDYMLHCATQRQELHTVVCVHHMPLSVGSYWLDTQGMHNQNEFMNCLERLPNVRLVLTGHIHQEFDVTHGAVRFIATPSTSIQFQPKAREFELDTANPGWRYLRFNPDGSIETEVCRLLSSFQPDRAAKGY
ncbi:MAG: 3',5'-cyclic-AMP phosphodiesterase [Succinivibrio sp.]|nr:3',5'-cyclic-AMP phosphodiesterase [Succinivibrio sp.]